MSNFFDRFSLSGKKSLVTGASKGIGEVIAKVLAEAGSDLVIVGRDKKGLNNTQQFVKKLGRDCLIISSDLSQKEGPMYAGEILLTLKKAQRKLREGL